MCLVTRLMVSQAGVCHLLWKLVRTCDVLLVSTQPYQLVCATDSCGYASSSQCIASIHVVNVTRACNNSDLIRWGTVLVPACLVVQYTANSYMYSTHSYSLLQCFQLQSCRCSTSQHEFPLDSTSISEPSIEHTVCTLKFQAALLSKNTISKTFMSLRSDFCRTRAF